MGLATITVRAIRALDQRGGFTTKRGEAAYARVASRLAGRLHGRIVDDAMALVGARPGAVVVDLGSGPGSLTAELGRRLPAASVVGVEPGRRMRDLASAAPLPPNVAFRAGSAEELPLDDHSVDLLVSALSAHHWTDLPGAVAEIRRVLAPGGLARIYDVRFATYTDDELAQVRSRLGLTASILRRSVPTDQGRFAPYALIEISG